MVHHYYIHVYNNNAFTHPLTQKNHSHSLRKLSKNYSTFGLSYRKRYAKSVASTKNSKVFMSSSTSLPQRNSKITPCQSRKLKGKLHNSISRHESSASQIRDLSRPPRPQLLQDTHVGGRDDGGAQGKRGESPSGNVWRWSDNCEGSETNKRRRERECV